MLKKRPGCVCSQLGAVTEMMVRFVLDEHPRVRWAAIHAIGQTCTDLGPNLQEEQHQQLLPALLKVMEDTGTPRVQVSGCHQQPSASYHGPRQTRKPRKLKQTSACTKRPRGGRAFVVGSQLFPVRVGSSTCSQLRHVGSMFDEKQKRSTPLKPLTPRASPRWVTCVRSLRQG
jgi:hypothetical protein